MLDSDGGRVERDMEDEEEDEDIYNEFDGL
jgi:hypothetical protein